MGVPGNASHGETDALPWVLYRIWGIVRQTPLLWRCFAFFFYSYFLRLGFLDGRAGLIYHVLQSFWFRFLVDAKIVEMRIGQKEEGDEVRAPAPPESEGAGG